MPSNDKELTLLSEEEIWGVNGGRRLDVIKKYGKISAITDLVILTGGICEDTCTYMAPDDKSLKGRTGYFYTRLDNGLGDLRGAYEDGAMCGHGRYRHDVTIRPVL